MQPLTPKMLLARARRQLPRVDEAVRPRLVTILSLLEQTPHDAPERPALLLALAALVPRFPDERDFHVSMAQFDLSATVAAGEVPSGRLWHAFITADVGISARFADVLEYWLDWRRHQGHEPRLTALPTPRQLQVLGDLDTAERVWHAYAQQRWSDRQRRIEAGIAPG